MRIFKYPIASVDDVVEVEMPFEAYILDVQMQHGRPVIWAMVDPDSGLVKRHFQVVGTGNHVNFRVRPLYVGTVQDGSFVWHFFDLGIA